MENKKSIYTKLDEIGAKCFMPVIWVCVAVIVICGVMVWGLTH